MGKQKSFCAVYPKAKQLMRNYLVMNHRVGKKIGNRSCVCEAHSHTKQKSISGQSKVMHKLQFGENMSAVK